MSVAVQRITPPAPELRSQNMPGWRVLLQMSRNVLGVWSERSFDELILRSRNFGGKALLVNDPEAARHVLSGGPRYRRPVSALRLARPIVGDGLLLSQGAQWKRQRRMLAPVFSPAGVGELLPHLQAAAQALACRREATPRADLSAQMHQTTPDATQRALFSRAPGESERKGLARMLQSYGRVAGRPTPLDAFARSEDDHAWATGGRRRFQAAREAMLADMVAERRANPGAGRRDLLALLLEARDAETGEGLSDAEIGDQMATMLFAGFETTSRLLFWAAYLLALDQAEQAVVREEVTRFTPDRVNRLDDLQHWPRLRLVLLETLRLYPPAPNIVREAVEADELAGEPVRPGDQIWISPWVMHRHRRLWSQPTQFIPERFEGQPSPWTGGAFMPFGGGPRICIGASFAMAEAQIVLATLIHRYGFSLADDRPVLPVAIMTMGASRRPMFQLQPARPGAERGGTSRRSGPGRPAEDA